MLNEPVKKSRTTVHPINALLIPVTDEAGMDSEQISCQKRQQLELIQTSEQQIEIDCVSFTFDLLKETVQHSGDLHLDHTDGQKRVLELTFTAVKMARAESEVIDGLTDQTARISNVL